MHTFPPIPRLKPEIGQVRARDLRIGDVVFNNDYPADVLENRPSRLFGPEWRIITWGPGDLDAALVHCDQVVAIALLEASP